MELHTRAPDIASFLLQNGQIQTYIITIGIKDKDRCIKGSLKYEPKNVLNYMFSKFWHVKTTIREDPRRGPATDRGQRPEDGGQPEARGPAAGRQAQEHLHVEVGAERGAGQEQEWDKHDDENEVWHK